MSPPTATSIPAGIVVTTPLGATGPTIGLGASSALAYGEIAHTVVGVPAGTHVVTISFTDLSTTQEAQPPGRDRIDALATAHTQVDAVVEYYPCNKGCSSTFIQRTSLPLDNALDGASLDLVTSPFTAASGGGRIYVRAGLVARASARGLSATSLARCSGRVGSITVA